ncbi:MAG TPA: tetratricopeptide repeat protein, partial [Isosphaeraceae bacterium]
MDPTSPHVTPPPAPRRPPYLLIAVTVLAVALVAAEVTEVVRRARLPRPPAVDTTGLDPAVARAIGSARARVEKDLLSGKAWGSLGQVYMAHAYNSEADACLVRAAALDPGEARWPYLLFEVRRPTSPETGLPHLERSVELCGDVLSPRLVLGEVLFEGGQLERAEGQFRAVLGRNPPNPRAHFGLGRIALARGDLVAGTDHLTKAAAAAPGFKAVHASLAQVYHRRSMTQEEKHELELVAALPNAWVWPNPYLKEVTDRWVGLSAGISWARELEKRGQARDAVKVLESLRTDYPDSPRLWLVLGSMLNGLGDFPKAEQAAREAVRTDQNRAAA